MEQVLTKTVRHTYGADYEFYRDSTGRVRLILIYPSAERMRQALDDDPAACPQCGLSGYCLCCDGLGPND